MSVSTYDVQPDDYHSGYVTCSDCDAEGARPDTWLNNKQEAHDAAIAAWNRRPSPAIPDREEIMGVLRAMLANLDALDDYMKQPERGDYGVECAVCMNEWLEPEDRSVMARARSLLAKLEGKS